MVQIDGQIVFYILGSILLLQNVVWSFRITKRGK